MLSQATYRVIHVFPESARSVNGPCSAIIAFMESQLQHGMDVRGLSPIQEDIPPEQSRPIEHLPIREVEFDAPGFGAVARESAAGGSRAVFHLHGIAPPTDKLARDLKQAAIPYVFTSHGQLLSHGLIHWLKKAVYLNLVSPFIRNASGLHLLTRRERARFKYLLPLWRGTFLVHPNLIRVPDPSRVTPRSRAELGIPAGAFVFAYLGRLHVQHKGLDLFVRAFARIPESAGAYLALIGPDHAGGRQFLDRLVSQLGCERRVCFLGPQVGDAKWSALKMADAFVSPSRWEAFSLAQAEAIGFGLPTIVSTRVNAASDFVSHHAALACAPSPAPLARLMQDLLSNEPLRRSLAEGGRQWVSETCSLAAAGARFAEFYSQVLQGPQPPP